MPMLQFRILRELSIGQFLLRTGEILCYEENQYGQLFINTLCPKGKQETGRITLSGKNKEYAILDINRMLTHSDIRRIRGSIEEEATREQPMKVTIEYASKEGHPQRNPTYTIIHPIWGQVIIRQNYLDGEWFSVDHRATTEAITACVDVLKKLIDDWIIRTNS